jgi:deoxyribodipyrimidine photo-lyase
MIPPRFDTGLVWFRRDLRLDDNAALHHALAHCRTVHCAFVFDRGILDALPSRADRRVAFIHASLTELDGALREAGGGLIVVHDLAADAIPALAARLSAAAVFAARDYEPEAVARDARVAERLAADGRALRLVKDTVVFETDEVMTGAERPFSVFTPYRNAWMRRLESTAASGTPPATDARDTGGAEPAALAAWPVRALAPGRLARPPQELRAADPAAPPGTAPVDGVPALATIGFEHCDLERLSIPTGASGASHLFDDFVRRIGRYRDARDYPAVRGPSYLSVHLRFGTVSVRTLAREAWRIVATDPEAAEGARTWLSELVWREFYFQVLHHHPRVVERSFKPDYDAIRWEAGERGDALFSAWCEGRTGYPLVDAAIAQIRASGYMHNRLRMVVASFLCKDLGIDWRRGERWFAALLNDFDLAANNGGWQWASSSGCDAQPYFRIFNPVTQSQKFDPKGAFIRRYLPQLANLSDAQIHAPWLMSAAEQARTGCLIGRDYPAPIVDHAQARARTLERYAVVKSAGAAGMASG